MKTLREEMVELVTRMLDSLHIKGTARVALTSAGTYIGIIGPNGEADNACIFRALGMDYPQIKHYTSDIVGYECSGLWPLVKSLEDLSKVVRKLYDDVISYNYEKSMTLRYPPPGSYLITPSDYFMENSFNNKDFKIEMIKLPTIGSLNFIY